MAMTSPKLLFFLSAILILIAQATAQPITFLSRFCLSEKGNYNADSTYATNLKQVLSLLTSNTENDYGFYNLSYGQDSDKVYAIGLCRGDVTPDLCRSCLGNSTYNLTQVCSNQTEAIEWYEQCMLRYSYRSIFDIMEDTPSFNQSNPQSVSANDVNQFKEVRSKLLDDLRSQAAAGGSLFKFATGDASVNSDQRIFALVQCTPELSAEHCYDCLDSAIGIIAECCDVSLGGKVVTPSCNLRFEISAFYGSPAYSAPPTSVAPSVSRPPPSINTTTTKGKGNTSRTVIIIIVVAIVALVVLAVISVIIYLRKKPKKKVQKSQIGGSSCEAVDKIVPSGTHINQEVVDEIGSVKSLQKDFGQIRDATNNFSDANKLGQGGYGIVYKGVLSDKQLIAVKRLSKDSRQRDLEFKNEVLLVAKLQHRNLVTLKGFCLEGNERLLIYEFVPNASLEHLIFGPMKGANLNWEKRYEIIKGIARGLRYIHKDSQLRIIHRDIKASNILLDADLIPKIADFGIAKLFKSNETQDNTSRIVGTIGYMAPEYANHGQFSDKSDVYSFGVLLMEIVSNEKNKSFRVEDQNLLTYAWKNWKEGTPLNLVHHTLKAGSTTEISQITRCIHIGLLCVQENADVRSPMHEIDVMLNSDSHTLPEPSQPAYYMHRIIESDIPQSNNNLGVSGSSQANSSSVHEASMTDPQCPR